MRRSRGKNISEQFEDWDHMADTIYFDEGDRALMRSVTVPGGDVEQVPTSPDAMKAEIGYPDAVMGDLYRTLSATSSITCGLLRPTTSISRSSAFRNLPCNSCSGRLAGMKETLPPP